MSPATLLSAASPRKVKRENTELESYQIKTKHGGGVEESQHHLWKLKFEA